jgi:NADH dehydrogenase/NADH:ubiquinone oxidoreductase subunit G
MSITLTIDQQTISVASGKTILEAGLEAGISIPTICFHEATTSNSLCRLCVVEVEGQRLLQPACTVTAIDNMVIHTRSERVMRARRTILEMLASSVDLSDAPEIREYMQEYDALTERFPNSKKRTSDLLDDNPMYIRDYSKCILCWRCVQVCADDAQYVNAINFSQRGYETQISTFYDLPMTKTTCVFCGQCVAVCPSGALKSKREYYLEEGFLPEQISDLVIKPGEKPNKKTEREND